MKLSKKTQSEAVGFVIIILIVIVIGVIFLGISLRKDKGVVTQDARIANFLSASLSYTTSCSKDYEGNYQPMDYVIGLCSRNGKCLDGNLACNILNQTYSEITPKFEASGIVNYYKLSFGFKVSNESDTSTQERSREFYSVSGGDLAKCASKRSGRSFIYPDLIIDLQICSV